MTGVEILPGTDKHDYVKVPRFQSGQADTHTYGFLPSIRF